jgi:AcrR family transcriptional regulator
MPSIRPSKEEVLTAYRRTALLQAAVRVFGGSGFEGATMDRMAKEAEVAKGTIYLYYASKQSIYDAALSAGFAELDERTRRAAQSAATLRDAIAGFIKARAGYFFEHPDFFRMYVSAIARQSTRERAQSSVCDGMVEQQTRRLEQAVSRAIARREIRRVDATATALAIFDLTRGLVARRMMAQAHADVTQDAAFLADLIWRGLTAAAKPEKPRRLRPAHRAGAGAHIGGGVALAAEERAGLHTRGRAENTRHSGGRHKAVRKR